MADQSSHRAYYAIIPADVRYCPRLPGDAKLLFGEITALCNQKGYCWASNSYFAELYGKSDRTIRRWVTALAAEGFIQTDLNHDSGTVRKITLRGADKNVLPGGQKCPEGADKNVLHNNTVNNTKKKKEEDMSLERRVTDTALVNQTHTVFQYWQKVMDKPRHTMTTERFKAITARLKKYTVGQLMQAIDGCRRSPHHMGENDTGTPYNDIELICRNETKVEQFIEYSTRSVNGKAKRNKRGNAEIIAEARDFYNDPSNFPDSD